MNVFFCFPRKIPIISPGLYERLNGVNRQPSNVQKCSRQPSKTGNFYRQPSNEAVIREIKTRVYGKRQTSDSRLRFLNIYNRFTRMVQNNSVYGKHETTYLACFRNGKRSTANEETRRNDDHVITSAVCRLPETRVLSSLLLAVKRLHGISNLTILVGHLGLLALKESF